MSTHRVCCCGDLQSPCYTGLTARVCVADGQPSQTVTNSNPGQICQLLFSQTIQFGLDTDGPAFLEYGASGIIGRAVTSDSRTFVSQAERDLITSTYALSQFDFVFIENQKTRVTVNGTGVGAWHIGFSAWSLLNESSALINYFPVPLDGVSVDGEPPLNSNLPWRTEARNAATATLQRCGTSDFFPEITETYTSTATGRIAQSRIESTRFGELSSINEMTTRLVPLLPYPQYLPGYTGPALCSSVQGVQANDINAAAIEAAQLNDPLRTCRGCGG